MPDTVNMVSPTGASVAVPIDQVAGYGAQGFRVETPGQAVEQVGTEARTAGMGGLVGSGLAAVGGLARGATLGLSDVAAREIGLGDTLAGAAEAHPTITTGATIAGAVAPAFAAPASLLAKTPAGLVSRAATSVAKLGEGAGVAARIGYAGAGGALEGGVQNAGSYISDQALADKPLAAEAFMAAMGHGALWGGAAGVGLATAERALVAAKRLFPKSEVTREAVTAAEDEAQQTIASAVDDGAALQQTARDKLRSIREEKSVADLELRKRLDEVKVQRAKDLAAVDVKAREAAGGRPRRTRKAMQGEPAAEVPPEPAGVPAYPANPDEVHSIRAGDLRGAQAETAGFDPAKVERYKAARATGNAPYLDEPINLTQARDGKLSIEQGRHRLAARADDEIIKARISPAYEPSPSELAASKAYDAALARGATSEELDAILRDGAKAKIAADDAADPLMAALQGTKAKIDAGEAIGGMGARAAKPARAIEDAMDDVAAVGDPAHGKLVAAERAYDAAQDELAAWLQRYPRSRVKGVVGAEEFAQKYGGGRSTVGRVRDYGSGPVGRFQGGAMERVSSISGTAEEQAAWMARKQAEELARPSMAEEILAGTKSLDDIKGVGYQAPVKSAGFAGAPGQRITADEILDISNLQRTERGRPVLDDHIAEALRARVADWTGDVNEAAQVISKAEAAHADLVDALGPAAPPASVARAEAYRDAVAGKAAQTATATADAAGELSKAADVVSLGVAPAAPAGVVGKLKGAVADVTKGGLGKLGHAGDLIALMDMLGVNVFDPSRIPVVGPVLAPFLKARVIAKVFKRMGGKIPQTAETVIASSAAASRQRVIDAIDRMTTTAARGAGRGIVPGASVATALGHTLFAGPGAPAKKAATTSPLAQFQARAAEVLEAQAPGAVRDAVRARVGAQGELLAEIVGSVERKMAFLASKLPLPQLPAIAGTPPWIPSRAQITSFARSVHGAERPVEVLEHAANGGQVTVEETEAVRACYPELYASAQRQLLERVARPDAAISYARRIQLSALFQVPLDRSTAPDYARWLQQGYTAQPPAGPTAPPQPTPTIAGPVDLGARTATAFDTRAGG